MSVHTRRKIFYVAWFLLLCTPVITFLKNTDISKAFSDPVLVLNSFQRLTGMTAFILLFIQIILGLFMDRWVQIIGSKAYKFHITQGLLTYGLVLIHPTLYLLITYEVSKNVLKTLSALLPSLASPSDILLVFGRTAFVLLTISVTAAYFRTKPFFRRNWRAFHILNYLVFYLIAFHAKVGTDLASQPFDSVYWLAIITVSAAVAYRFIYPIIKKVIPVKLTAEKVPQEK